MKVVEKSIGVILVCSFLTGCTSSIDTSTEPITGIVKSFCVELKPDMEQADSNFWTLGKSTSMETFVKSMFEVSQDANTIAIVSTEPAKSWLTAVGTNATDFLRYFSGDLSGGSEELLGIASRWNATYLELPKYCD